MGSGVLRRFWEKKGEGSGRTVDSVCGNRKGVCLCDFGGDMVVMGSSISGSGGSDGFGDGGGL